MVHDQLSIILTLKPNFVDILSCAGLAGAELIFIIVAALGVVLDLS